MNMNDISKSCTLEDIPEEVVYTHIFPCLNPIDVYNLSYVSRRMKYIVDISGYIRGWQFVTFEKRKKQKHKFVEYPINKLDEMIKALEDLKKHAILNQIL